MKKRRLAFGKILLSIGFISASFFLLQPVVQEVVRTFELRDQLKLVEAELQALEAENLRLEEQKLKLLDPDYVKSYARANYMLTKEGEQIYYLPKTEDNE